MRMKTTCMYLLILWMFHVKGRRLKDSSLSYAGKKMQLAGLDKQSSIASLEEMMVNDDEISDVEQNLGQNYFQGDFLTTKKQKRILNHLISQHSHDQPDIRGLVKDIGRTWENGVLYFIFNKNVDYEQEKLVRKAMHHWEKKTCLRFKERENDKDDYVIFTAKDRCASYIGRKGGKQKLYVGNRLVRCKLGNIIHEIAHAVGFFHEQTRPDRDEFVKIKWKNILKGRRNNFVKFSSSVIDSRDSPYDYNSIMHYGSRYFAINRSKPNIVPKGGHVNIGQRIGLSNHDIRQAKLLYNCNPMISRN